MKIIITEDQYNKLVEYKKSMDFGFELSESVVESVLGLDKAAHLPMSVIDDMSDPKMASVLKAIVTDGPSKGLGEWKNMVNNDSVKDIDFEDLLSISTWIDGSVTNKNPKEVQVPDFIIGLVKQLS
jgi:hypothetical protein